MSTIKVNKILSANNPNVDVADGLTVTGEVKVGSAVTSNSTGIDVTGVVTATSFVGSGANLTGIDATAIQTGTTKVQTSATLISNQISGAGIATVQAGGLDVTGVTTSTNVSVASSVTATTFYGSGANLTGIDATSIKDSGGNVKIQGNNSGATVTGILTAVAGNPNEGAFISPTAVGVGTTTLAGRNAGVSTAVGTLVYNITDEKLQVWMGTDWADASTPPPLSATGGSKSTSSRSGYTVHTFSSPGTFTVATGKASSGDVEVFVLAGGGSGGGGRHSGGGGAGAIQFSNTQTLAPGNYSVTVGSGGATAPINSPGKNDGQNSVFGSITAAGGGSGGSHPWADAGNPGGSGGGEAHSSAGAGTGSGDPGGSNGSASPANGWGNNGGTVPNRAAGGGGGGANQNGSNGNGPETGTSNGGPGGNGLQYGTDGTSYYYAAGGGGSANPSSCQHQANGGSGGTGGGGGGAACGGRSTGGQSGGSGGGSARNGGSGGAASNANNPTNVANGGNAGTATGSGGGAAAGWAGYGGGTGGAGGPGLVIVAYPTALTE